ncbi:MAG: hypothetical protein C4520_20505 [Candidatus Abyssobacteria bacterium SURF_5]|uniref:Glycoside hydrolase family 38 central domain-containing protein n=1 Tax=Abyssobacteria bacterium (strain SURF_5) TaxID=2093360 RepID=A0A3A4NJ48_ABYX5|nr:MAG: hypothetical protein C4520_20505 [Candidatus Abyssubacteria bacterium SURF_5]
MNLRHLVVVPHTHWDREWYMPFERFRKRLVSMVDHLLEVLENDRAFTCFELDGQTILLDDYLAIRPENRKRLEKLIRQERILIGPWYVQPDEFLVTGESLIRNLRMGIRSAKKYGKASSVGYLPDQFGHIAQMPQVLAGFGIRSAVVWRGVGRTVTETQFLWESPDGTQLFTVYLATSYGNGAFLPLNPKQLSDSLRRVIQKLEPYCSIRSMLIMNGLDHLEPQEGLPEQLEKAVRRLEGVTAEIGSLDAFIQQARKQARSLSVHRGEFRSPERAPLLPGVTSTRIRQKQRAFECCRLLERYVEPLSAWAGLCGDTRPHGSFIEHAWRLILQNQPHDSICGCSVDKVHEEMETRFDRVEQLGKALQKDCMSFLASQVDSRHAPADSPVLCVFNPTAARFQLVDVEVDLEEPDFIQSVKDADGSIIPLQKTVGERELFVQTEETPEMVRSMVSGMEDRELIGYYINNVLWRKDGNILHLNLIMGRAPAGEIDFDKRRKELLAALEDPTIATVKIRGISGARTTIRFPAKELAPHGLTLYSLSGESAGGSASGGLEASKEKLENQHYRITINSDGTIDILDKDLAIEYARCLHFIDEGDRGDTYNFDEVQGAQPVAAPVGPVAVSVIENGPVRAAVRIEAVYRIPERLTPERDARSTAAVETRIKTEISLYRDTKRIDFRVSLENKSEDHRLRVWFHAPFKASDAVVETTFGTVRRPVSVEPAEGFLEKPVGTGPQKCFTCLEGGSTGFALFNRGIPEIEALFNEKISALALTLIRSIGWLSRDDLFCRPGGAGPQFKTPGAQSQGRHSFEFAFLSYAGNFVDAGIAHAAHAYAFPPIAAITNRHNGKLRNRASLVAADNSNIIISAIERSRQKDSLLVRMYNGTESSQRTRVILWKPLDGAHEVNFLERQLSQGPLSLSRKGISFRPGEIKTIRVNRK